MTRPYAEVIGDPIAHSKSPLIHKFWLAKLGIVADYRATHVTADGLAAHVATRAADPDWRGMNVTIPHKIAVLDQLDTLEPEARRVGAVNTVIPAISGALIGHNTDIDGVRRPAVLNVLARAMADGGASIIIVGGGGAARAAVAALTTERYQEIVVVVRDPERVAAAMPGGAAIASFESLDALISTADLLINASPLGMTGQADFPKVGLLALTHAKTKPTVFDMVYAPLETPLLAAARARGLDTIDGLEMLIGQAGLAFELFFGQPAPREHDAELRALLTS